MNKKTFPDFKGSTSDDIVDFLKNFSGEELVKHLGGGFSAVLDDFYMPAEPSLLYSPGNPHPVQLLLGFNSHEGAKFIFDLAKSKTIPDKKNAMDLLEHIIKKMFFRGSPVGEQIVKLAQEEYMKPSEDYVQGLTDLYGDLLFIAPSILIADLHSGINHF